MKTKLPLLLAILLPLAAHAADDFSIALQKGLFEEEANQNLPAAIQAYESLLVASDEQRKLTATALFRLGECYRKLGQTNDAIAQYQRLIRDFTDQTTLATLSRQNLVGLGARTSEVPPPASNPAERTDPAIRAEALRAEALLKQLSALTRGDLRRVLPTAAPDPLLNTLLEQLADGERRLASARTSFADDHPTVKATRDGLKVVQEQIEERIGGIMQGLAIKAASLKQQAGEPAGGSTGSVAVIDEEEQEIRRIQAIIKDSPDLINAAGKDRTPLHVAAAEGKLSVVRFLLDNGAKPDLMTTDSQGPALLLAAENGHKAVVELLLARGADPNIKDGAALQAAAANGFMAIVDVLLANKADINRQGGSGTALHRAVYMKRGAIAERLLKSGVNADALSRAGETPLHIAAQRADAEMIKLLLSFKADINAKDRGDAPPLWRVWDNLELNVPVQSKVDAARAFLEGGAAADFTVQGQSPVHGALRLNSVELVELLLKYKAAPDLPNREGLTPLHVITLRRRDRVEKPDADLISKLVSAGANPNRRLPLSARATSRYEGTGGERSYSDYPPLCAAVSRGDMEVAEALLASGADVNGFVTQGQDRHTALMYAVYAGSPAMVEAVLRFKPDLESKTETSGRTALHNVATQYATSPEVISAMAKAGANVNATDNGLWTPLHIAVEGGRPTAVKALLEVGANPNAMTASGAVPLSIARRTQGQNVPSKELSDELVQLLLKHGADEMILRRRTITVTRRSANYEEEIFRRGTNDFNRFSLYEITARLYQQGGPNPPFRLFPDLRQVAIERIGDGGGTLQLVVDLEARASGESCTNDMWLEWGDRIEIREKEHPLNAIWPGLDGTMATNVSRCISRVVTLVIKGRTNQIDLAARVHHSGTVSDTDRLMHGYRVSQAHCGLNGVLQKSGLLLTTSDLSRVRVTRRDSQSGKLQEWILDETKFDWTTDFWMRDGDVIEVPEKGANTEPSPLPTGGIQPNVSPLRSPPTRSIRSLPVLPPPVPPEPK